MPRKNSSKNFKDINAELGAEELIKRLKSCLKYVEEHDVIEDTASLLSLSGTLVLPSMMAHKSREVPLLSSCILIQILKVFAEDLPFGEEQIKKILNLFISQLSVLENPSSSLFNWGYTLLENMSLLKVFMYAVDIEAYNIISDLFAKVVSVINPSQSTQVRTVLLNILVNIIQETKSGLPVEAFNSLMSCIIEPQKSRCPAACDFVTDLIKRVPLHLEHHVNKFYVSAMSNDSESDSSSRLTNHLYEIIYALHEIDSSVVLSVLPQLEDTLMTTNEVERMQVTKVLGKMFAAKRSQLAIENKRLWQSFLGRFRDISVDIRCECVAMSKHFLHHQNLREDTSERLLQRLVDSEERVRAMVMKTICEAAIEDLNVVPEKVFSELKDRMRDRKPSVRKESIQSLCRLYRHCMNQKKLSTIDPEKIDWIPNKLLHCMYQKIREDNVIISRGILDCIVTISLDPKIRMNHLLNVFNSLDENAIRAFEEYMKQRRKIRSLLKDLVTIENDSDLYEKEKKKLFTVKTVVLNGVLSEPVTKSLSNLKEIVSSLQRISKPLLRCLDEESSYSEIMKAKSEVLKVFSKRPSVLETLKSLLDLGCPILVCKKSAKLLVEKVTNELCDPSLGATEEIEEEEQIKHKNGLHLIKILSSVEPKWFEDETILTGILSILRSEDQTVVENSIAILSSIGNGIEKWRTVSGNIQTILVGFVTKGTPKVSKLSLRCLRSIYSKMDSMIDRLLDNLLLDLSIDSPNLLTTFSALSQIARFYPMAFLSEHTFVVKKFVPEIIATENAPPKRKGSMDLWCDKEEVVYDVKLKIAALKLLVSWIIGLHVTGSEDKERDEHVEPVIGLLTTILQSGGNSTKGKMSPSSMSHLRLAAGAGFLKLARLAGYSHSLSITHFQLLLDLTTDSCPEVSEAFITKLYKALRSSSLPYHYIALFCMVSSSTHGNLTKSTLKTMLSSVVKILRDNYEAYKMKAKSSDEAKAKLSNEAKSPDDDSSKSSEDESWKFLPEYALPHVVYLISHHKEFSRSSPKTLNYFRDNLWFFLEALVSKTDNYGLIQKLMEDIKQTICVDHPKDKELNKNVYAVCDLVIAIINSKSSAASWGNFPGKTKLPKKLYIAPVAAGKKLKPNEQIYLPVDYTPYPGKAVKDLLVVPVNKRKRTATVRNNTNSSNKSGDSLETEISDAETATPLKKKKVTPPSTATKAGRKRSPKKQLKLSKTSNVLVTSTPAVGVKQDCPPPKNRNPKRKVQQQDENAENKPSPRRSTRLRKSELSNIDEQISEEQEGLEANSLSPLLPLKHSNEQVSDEQEGLEDNDLSSLLPPEPSEGIKRRKKMKRRR